MPTNFQKVTASADALAALLTGLPILRGPWDEAFDRYFCQKCQVKDCDAEGCPHQAVRKNVILWWLKREADRDG